MNRYLLLSILSALLLMLIPKSAYSWDFTVDSLYYRIISMDDMTVEIEKGGETISGDLVIPTQVTFKGRTFLVKNIGRDAFSHNPSITSVVFPQSIDSVKIDAFLYCSKLDSINIDSVPYIGRSAFNYCALKSISIPPKVKYVGVTAFGKKLQSYRIGYSPDTLIICTQHQSYIKDFYIDRIIDFRTRVDFGYDSPLIDNDSLISITFGPHTDQWFEEYSGPNLKDVYSESTDPAKMTPHFSRAVCIYSTLHVPTGTKTAYEQAEGWKDFWTIVDDVTTTGIQKVQSESNASVSSCNGEISISGLLSGEKVAVYDLSGTLICTAKASANGTAIIGVNCKGVVVVKTSHISKKVVIRL